MIGSADADRPPYLTFFDFSMSRFFDPPIRQKPYALKLEKMERSESVELGRGPSRPSVFFGGFNHGFE